MLIATPHQVEPVVIPHPFDDRLAQHFFAEGSAQTEPFYLGGLGLRYRVRVRVCAMFSVRVSVIVWVSKLVGVMLGSWSVYG